jgi:hypothetical protein
MVIILQRAHLWETECICLGKDIRTVLLEFTAWMEMLKKTYDTNDIFLWGNGAAADIAWISSAYSACHLPTPWKFWHERDVRTMTHIGKLLKGIRLIHDENTK